MKWSTITHHRSATVRWLESATSKLLYNRPQLTNLPNSQQFWRPTICRLCGPGGWVESNVIYLSLGVRFDRHLRYEGPRCARKYQYTTNCRMWTRVWNQCGAILWISKITVFISSTVTRFSSDYLDTFLIFFNSSLSSKTAAVSTDAVPANFGLFHSSALISCLKDFQDATLRNAI